MLALAVQVLQIAGADGGERLLPVYSQSDSFLLLHRAWFAAFVASDGGFAQAFVPDTPYLWLLTEAYQWLGPEAWVPFSVNAVLAALGAGFVALTTRLLFDTKAGHLAGLLFALCGPVVFFAGITIKTTLVLSLLAAAGYFVVRYLRGAAVWNLVLGLLLLALTALERNNALVLVGWVAALALGRAVSTREWWMGVRDGFLSLGIVALVSGAWGAGEEGVGLRGSPLGVNFYTGNAPGSRGGYTPFADGRVRDNAIGNYLDAPRVAEAALGRTLSPAEVSRYWLTQSWHYYRDHPGEYAYLQLRKAAMLLARYAPGSPEEYRVWRSQRPALWLAFVDYGAVLVLAAAGLVLCRRELKRSELLYLAGGVLLYAGSVWLFLVTERLRMPLLVLLMPFAGLALARLLERRRWPAFVLMAGALVGGYAASAALCAINDPGAGWDPDGAKLIAREGTYYQRHAALYALRRDVALDPSAALWGRLAQEYRRRGYEPDVPVYAERAIALEPQAAIGYELLYDHLLIQGDLAGLARLRERVAEVSGRDAADRRRIQALMRSLEARSGETRP